MFKVRDQRGASFIQILMASSALAALAIIGIKMAKDQEQLASNLAQNFEINYIVAEIKAVLSDPASCRATVLGSNPVDDDFSIRSIKREVSGGAQKSGTLYLHYSSESENTLYGNENIRIKSYAISDKDKVVNAKLGSTHLIISFEKIGSIGGDAIAKRKIPLSIKLDSRGQIESCRVQMPGQRVAGGFKSEGEGNLSYSKGPIQIGKTKPIGHLSLAGGLKLESSEGSCLPVHRGQLRYNNTIDSFEYCNGGGSWRIFGQRRLNVDSSFSYQVDSEAGKNKLVETKNHRLCVLSSIKKKSNIGDCKVKRNWNGSQVTWSLSAISDGNYTALNCKFECFN